MELKLSPKSVARVREMVAKKNAARKVGERKLRFDDLVEWAVLRQYNRERAVVRNAMSMRNEVLEVSPLEEREERQKRDDDE